MRLVPTLMIAACATAAPIQRLASIEPELPADRDPASPAITPWFRAWDVDAERERLVRIGATDVAGLEAEYARACGPSATPAIIGSPLLRYRTGSWNTRTGVIVYLSPLAGPGDVLLADLRCHFAGMLLAPFGADDCPFDVPGFHIDARGDAAVIVLSVTAHPSSIFELQRRIGREVDTAGRQSHED
jgi:hypothetical protein